MSSYNHNGKFYVLSDVPRFDDWGLWSWRDVRFSQAGTLCDTVLGRVEQSPAGCTTVELAARLLVDVAHLLSRLVREKRIGEHRLAGRQVVYLAAEPVRAQQQWQQRQRLPIAPTLAGRVGLPDGIAARQVIDILRQMIITRAGRPDLWTRTTNRLESNWGQCKRGRRQSHGRGKLIRDFQSLPAEDLLVSNLENAKYVDLILGGSPEQKTQGRWWPPHLKDAPCAT